MAPTPPITRRLTSLWRNPRPADEIDAESQSTHAEVAMELKAPPRHRKSRSASPTNPAATLLGLPAEVQLIIFRHLKFGDLESVRRTCRHFRRLLGHDTVISLFGSVADLHRAQMVTCSVCLRTIRDHQRIWVDPASDPSWPLSSKCVDCAFVAGLDIDKSVTLGNWANCHICRWCGRPCIQLESPHLLRTHEFHPACWTSYKTSLSIHGKLGLVDFCFCLLANIFVLAIVRDWQFIVPSAVCLLLAIVVNATQLYRNNDRATMYHVVALGHLLALILWSLVFARLVVALGHHSGRSKAVLYSASITIPVSMVFRIVSIFGNILLTTNYKPWRHLRPCRSGLGLAWRDVQTCLMVWTWPRCVEYSWPPEPSWFPDNGYGRFLYRLRLHGFTRRTWPPSDPTTAADLSDQAD